ncbi:uncharacterized protein LOC114731641 [Neltuma alba]|uniref:uncharacterized protein LOC114731641 n=1 Tax=Neltuma alba TaxID=207710 RepID=UPI0010A43F95|nr:uncharacterized protein LOC114731641 [Prosopis alba]
MRQILQFVVWLYLILYYCVFCLSRIHPHHHSPKAHKPRRSQLQGMAAGSSITKSLKARLRCGGETLYGLLLASFSPTLTEIAGLAGYDFVVIDLAHGHGDIANALSCLRALCSTQTPAIIRLPENSETWAKKALDLGPQGLIFPLVNHPDSARAAVSYSHYPPKGVRGAAFPAVRASNYGFDPQYLAKCENDLLVMCEVESVDALDRINDIASVEGVDCIMLGPFGVSPDMNESLKNKLLLAEKSLLELKCESEKAPSLAALAVPHDPPLDLKRRGYDMVCTGVDVALFRDAAIRNINMFKN